MSTENHEILDRVASNLALIAGAISTLAEAVNGTYKGQPIYAQTGATQPPTEAPAATKRGRGRPVKGEEPAAVTPAASPAVQATPAASAPADDPFAPKPAAPTATIEQVREALTILRAATTQDNAVAVMKAASGADNITAVKPEQYAAVVAAATAALPPVKTEQPAEIPDPFATPAAAAPAAKAPTIEDVKALIVETQKRASQDTVQKVVMAHGGKAALPSGGEGPSLKALPPEQFAAVIAALKNLPSTK